jgi:hypothetical protein
VPLPIVMALAGLVSGPSQCCDVGSRLPARCRAGAQGRQTAAELALCPVLDGSTCTSGVCHRACALQRAECACSRGMSETVYVIGTELTVART